MMFKKYFFILFFLMVSLVAVANSQSAISTPGGVMIIGPHTPRPTASPSPTPTPTPGPTLPPQGAYTSCDILDTLSTCETYDLQAANIGLKLKVDYNSLLAHKTAAQGSGNMQSWLTYDASIGIKQIFSVKCASQDGLSGTACVTLFSNLATDCSATTNQQMILCVYNTVGSYSAFWGWYIYDEPGCPNQTIGYCQGSLAGDNYANVASVATYIASIDSTHPILGIQTPSGVPATGGWNSANGITQISNLMSCNSNCSPLSYWITGATTPNTGLDYYPFGCPSGISCNQSASDIDIFIPYVANVFTANYSSEKFYFTGQALDWAEEGSCSPSTCSFPTAAQMQNERDKALWDANAAGYPLQGFFWYAQDDVNCLNNPISGCNASARLTAWTSAVQASFPTSQP